MGKKNIIIGCDDTAVLPMLVRAINQTSLFVPSIVSATRLADLAPISKTINPDLAILCFRNNRQVLHEFTLTTQKVNLPILCLTRKYESDILTWNKDHIVFSYPLEPINQADYLVSRMQSIFLLNTKSPEEPSAPASHRPASEKNDLSKYVMELDQKMEVLSQVKDRIADLYPQVDDVTRKKLSSIVNSIKMSANNDKLWDDFKLYYSQESPDFLQELAQMHPELTPKDLKYCCYLKMNMTNDDIRNLLGINQESVRTHKYRLKKKMALSKDQDLRTYLRSVSGKQTKQR